MTVMIAVAAAAAARQSSRRTFSCCERSDAVLGARVNCVPRLPNARPVRAASEGAMAKTDHRQASNMADLLVKVRDGWWDNMAGNATELIGYDQSWPYVLSQSPNGKQAATSTTYTASLVSTE